MKRKRSQKGVTVLTGTGTIKEGGNSSIKWYRKEETGKCLLHLSSQKSVTLLKAVSMEWWRKKPEHSKLK
jgi:hypothetical protein